MKVITGIYGGRKLISPADDNIRPTSDMVRQALFNILGSKIYGAIVCDLFSGTGAIGIEALSRGCSEVYFSDNNGISIDLLEQNINNLKIVDSFHIEKKDYKDAIKNYISKEKVFDIIFIDPPYKKNIAQDAMTILSSTNLINKDSIIIVEHEIADIMNDKYGKIELTKSNKYGKKRLSIYRLVEDI